MMNMHFERIATHLLSPAVKSLFEYRARLYPAGILKQSFKEHLFATSEFERFASQRDRLLQSVEDNLSDMNLCSLDAR